MLQNLLLMRLLPPSSVPPLPPCPRHEDPQDTVLRLKRAATLSGQQDWSTVDHVEEHSPFTPVHVVGSPSHATNRSSFLCVRRQAGRHWTDTGQTQWARETDTRMCVTWMVTRCAYAIWYRAGTICTGRFIKCFPREKKTYNHVFPPVCLRWGRA